MVSDLYFIYVNVKIPGASILGNFDHTIPCLISFLLGWIICEAKMTWKLKMYENRGN